MLLCKCLKCQLKHCVDDAHSCFTILQKYNQFCIPDQWDSTSLVPRPINGPGYEARTVHAGFIAPTSPEMQLFMADYTELKQLETRPVRRLDCDSKHK